MFTVGRAIYQLKCRHGFPAGTPSTQIGATVTKRPIAGAGAPVMPLDVVAFGAQVVVVVDGPVPDLNGVKCCDLRHGRGLPMVRI
jgi:hypothetical protein